MAQPTQGGAQPQGQQNRQHGGGYRGGGGGSPVDTMRAVAEIIEAAEARAKAHPAVFEKAEVARARGEGAKNRAEGQAALAMAQNGIAAVPLKEPANAQVASNRVMAGYKATSAEDVVAIHEAVNHPPGAWGRVSRDIGTFLGQGFRAVAGFVAGHFRAVVIAVLALFLAWSLLGCVSPGAARKDIIGAIDSAGKRDSRERFVADSLKLEAVKVRLATDTVLARQGCNPYSTQQCGQSSSATPPSAPPKTASQSTDPVSVQAVQAATKFSSYNGGSRVGLYDPQNNGAAFTTTDSIVTVAVQWRNVSVPPAGIPIREVLRKRDLNGLERIRYDTLNNSPWADYWNVHRALNCGRYKAELQKEDGAVISGSVYEFEVKCI